ncbi:hypothetical protein BKA67DRAFT_544695 [Truncatella angustata]|uniref:Uncharacterized protein n=1 Tax=Truncatella angustata TaxID=152316 RepID=A0A9P8UWL8_9PEZI|nr:uncharacterized protein BKA67DRAFT_544695 [Truncatella angustata]KAH6659520.1 hypothetical protein BKA67DRAFT_544695 [Truncatella angustata]
MGSPSAAEKPRRSNRRPGYCNLSVYDRNDEHENAFSQYSHRPEAFHRSQDTGLPSGYYREPGRGAAQPQLIGSVGGHSMSAEHPRDRTERVSLGRQPGSRDFSRGREQAHGLWTQHKRSYSDLIPVKIERAQEEFIQSSHVGSKPAGDVPDLKGKNVALSGRMEVINRESASTPITITTGYDLDQTSCPFKQDHVSHLDRQADEALKKPITTLPTQTLQQAHNRSCDASVATQKTTTRYSDPSTPLKKLQNHEHHPKTQKTDSASDPDVPPRKSFLQDCSPKTPRMCPSPKAMEQGNCKDSKLENLRAVKSHKADLHHVFQRDQREAAVQAAARTAMLRCPAAAEHSPTQTHAHRKSSSAKSPHKSLSKDRSTASPCKQENQQQKSPSAASGGIDGHSKSSDLSQKTNTDAVTIPYIILYLVIQNVLEISFAWWFLVRPAFNKQSSLWRRRQKGISTLTDLAIFFCAGLFCVIGTLIAWCGFKFLNWLHL